MRISLRFLLPLALVACHHDAAAPLAANSAPPSTGLACGKVADHLIGMMPASASAPQDTKDKMSGAFSQSCEQDQWSEDAKSCLMAAQTHNAMSSCNDKLTKAQLDSATQRMDVAMGRPMNDKAMQAAESTPAPAADAAPPPPMQPASAPPPKASKHKSSAPSKPGKTGGDPCDGSE